MTDDEERAVAEGRFDARALVDRQRAAVEPIVAAIAEQTKTYFDVQLPADLAEAVDERRDAVRARAAVQANLTWPVGWKQEEPKLVEREADRTTEDLVSESIEHRCRLDSATFDDIQRTIRVWADAVERYPDAFRHLHENRLSDLLAATLNASLPGANRKFTHEAAGPTYSYRRMYLMKATPHAKIFICESKWWDGQKAATRALGQLLRYLEAKDTSAILLFFVRTRRPAAVRPKAHAALSKHTRYAGASPEAMEGWPILRFNGQRQHVAVCVGFIDLPAV